MVLRPFVQVIEVIYHLSSQNVMCQLVRDIKYAGIKAVHVVIAKPAMTGQKLIWKLVIKLHLQL